MAKGRGTAKHCQAIRYGSIVERLGKLGGKAFAALCKRGCDREILDGHLQWLQPETTLESGRSIQLHPLDSWEIAFGGLTRRQVRVQIPRLARKLYRSVLRLQQTPVVDYLVATGKIRSNDLLNQSPFPLERPGPGQFRTLLALPQIARQVGFRKHPDVTRDLASLCRYVHSSTNGWRDAEVSSILADLFPSNPDMPKDQEALKKWRRKHGLVHKSSKGIMPRPGSLQRRRR